MDTTLSPPTGDLLDGRYLVESRLAQGGMATVYLGRDLRLDRIVALKIAHPELAGDREFVRRFITEARSAAQLSSPNVVGVYDQGSVGDVHYIAMEYVPGATLREVLNARGALSVRESLDVIEGVLAGLGAAHRAGIIHRDVKPENVLLGQDGTVKVADFGLARAAAAVARTATGMIIGTPAYLAPEQVSASTSDARTDVYAAGVMLFEMLTGAQPHTGESALAVAYKHVSDVVPPPSSLVPGLPPALDALVALATSRDPDLRPPDAGQFLYAVTEVRHGAPLSSARRGQHAAPSEPLGAAPPGRTDGLAGPPGAAPPGRTDGLTGPPGAAHAGRTYEAAGPPREADPLADTDLRPALVSWAGQPPAIGPHHDQVDATGDLIPQPTVREEPRSHRSANHTLVVSAGSFVPGFRDSEDDRRRRPHASRHWDHEPPLQRLLFSRRLIYVLGTVAVVLITVLLVWWFSAGQYTKVPQVAGWSAGLARTELTGLGFKVHDGPGRHSTQARGHIISTRPAAGAEVRTGSAITFILSLGPAKVQVPAVTGLPLQQAQQQLKASGLTPGPPTATTSTTIAAGVVISTDPVAGTAWPKNKPVGITVSAGPPLPSFVGGPATAAQAAASAGGYQIQQVPDTKSSQPSGIVTRQSPAAGTPIHSGEVVTVYVSQGPPLVSVPNVDGMPAPQAVQALKAAGFKVVVNKGLGGIVTDYSPKGQAPAGSAITINVGFTFF